ncbi:MAG: DoxX-like family protein, partial [Myxococcota bacterium]
MDASANRAVLRADDALRISLALVWLLEGLLPKILFLRPAETEAFTRAVPFLPGNPEPLVRALGGFETLLGALLLAGLVVLPILWIMLGLLVLFTGLLLVQSPVLVLDPTGGLIKNVALIGATGALVALRRGAFAEAI